jgi:glycosyltransferase involved in cell wall biosynthesis
MSSVKLVMLGQNAQNKTESPWVMVAEGIHRRGGMDKANAALAEYLSSQGRPVHLVAFSVDRGIAELPGIATTYATMPARSPFLGRFSLGRLGNAMARKISREFGDAHVLVNGTSCDWADINWVHWVHHCWDRCDREAPLWFKLKNRLDTSRSLRSERTWFANCKLFLANSERTRRDLIDLLGIEPQRVHAVYLGSDSEWTEFTPERRKAARAWLEVEKERPLVAFVGTFGYDSRKGFDTLWRAWTSLCGSAGWDADLVVAGSGRTKERWQTEVARVGLGTRVRFLGFTERIPDVLAASDLLVSPVRYESYGLNVHEALCFGVPAIVSANAGVAERFLPEAAQLLLPDPEDVDDLAARMLNWRSDIVGWKRRIEATTRRLRAYTWNDMARQIVSLADRLDAART